MSKPRGFAGSAAFCHGFPASRRNGETAKAVGPRPPCGVRRRPADSSRSYEPSTRSDAGPSGPLVIARSHRRSLVRRLSLQRHCLALVYASRAGVLADGARSVGGTKRRQLLGVGHVFAESAANAACRVV